MKTNILGTYVRDWSQDFEISFKLYFIFLRQFLIVINVIRLWTPKE